MLNNKKIISGLSFLIIFTLIFSFTTEKLRAESISPEKAIEIGLKNSAEIEDLKNNIDQIKRNIESVKAQKDWKIDFAGEYTHHFDEEDNLALEEKSDSSINQDSISITANKLYDFGLSFNPALRVTEDDERIDLSLTQQLYPITNSELENQLYNLKKDLINAEEELKNIKASKIITWVQSYLNIVRMKEREKIYLESVKKAEDNLKKVKKEKNIGEGGENQLLTAKYSLEDAKYKLKEQRYNIDESINSFENELGLNGKMNILFQSENNFILNLKEKTNKITGEYLNNENLLSLVEKNNSSLKTIKLDRKILERELENLKKEDDLNIRITGKYDTLSENLTATIDFSYNLYDGGKHGINLESKKASLKNNINNYEDKVRKLKLDLENHLNKLSLDKDRLAKEELNYKRSKNELDIAEIKYDRGIIDYLEYQDNWIVARESGINLKSIKDTIFINKLEFIKFVNSENITGGF
ncbi:MAG TPA: TolC family protein [Halanaerobiales bacterium]|nr:TolC family protein [Halanaerobiales bacterium]